MLRVFVFENKMVSLEYFLDEMQEYEINTLARNAAYVDRNNKEIQRMQMYILAQCNSKKKLKLQDIMKFKWDEENINTGTEVDENTAKAYRERMKQLEGMIQNTTIVSLDNKEVLKLK